MRAPARRAEIGEGRRPCGAPASVIRGAGRESPEPRRALLVARLYGADVGPSLNIARSNGAAIVSWPATATGFVLDQSLTPTGGWSQVAFPYTTNASDIRVSVPVPTGNKFYRLRKP